MDRSEAELQTHAARLKQLRTKTSHLLDAVQRTEPLHQAQGWQQRQLDEFGQRLGERSGHPPLPHEIQCITSSLLHLYSSFFLPFFILSFFIFSFFFAFLSLPFLCSLGGCRHERIAKSVRKVHYVEEKLEQLSLKSEQLTEDRPALRLSWQRRAFDPDA